MEARSCDLSQCAENADVQFLAVSEWMGDAHGSEAIHR